LANETIKILQVGDVHFPDGMAMSASIDLKDDGVTSSLSRTLASNPFQESVRGLYQTIERENPDLVAFMGDLTTRGDLNGYAACLEYFAKGLCFGSAPIIDPEKVLIVAGNHDVCRDTAINKGGEEKFNVLNGLLKDKGFEALTITELDMSNPNGTASLIKLEDLTAF